MTLEEEQKYHFDLFLAKYPRFDYVKYMYGKYDDGETGYYRWRCYHDGAWLEGYRLDEVIYWGA